MVRVVRFAWDDGVCPVDLQTRSPVWPVEHPQAEREKSRDRRPNRRRDGEFERPDCTDDRPPEEGRAA